MCINAALISMTMRIFFSRRKSCGHLLFLCPPPPKSRLLSSLRLPRPCGSIGILQATALIRFYDFDLEGLTAAESQDEAPVFSADVASTCIRVASLRQGPIASAASAARSATGPAFLPSVKLLFKTALVHKGRNVRGAGRVGFIEDFAEHLGHYACEGLPGAH